MSPFTRCATATLLALALSPLQAAGPAGRKLQPTELFNHAEKQYAALFPTHAMNQSLPPGDRISIQASNCALNGAYRFASSFLTPTSDYTETVSFDDLRVSTFSAGLQFADAKLFFTDGAEQLARAEDAITLTTGRRSTPARLELSVPVAMKVDQSSIRPRPTTGTLRLGGYGYNVDLKFLGNGTLDLAADNGPDGSNDITRRVTELELDQQLVR